MSRRVQLPPGDYTVRNITAGTTSTVTVPTLTVAITQAALTVGQTASLISNANTGPGSNPAYQWTLDGTDIPGATAATYTTAATGALRCRVTSGAQIITSAPVTVAAAPSLTATYVGNSIVSNIFQEPAVHTAPATLTAGTRYIIAVVKETFSGTEDFGPMTVGGATATIVGTASVLDNRLQVRFYDVTPTSNATTVSISLTGAGNAWGRSILHYWSIPAGATVTGGAGSTEVDGAPPRVVSANVGAGNLVLGIAAGVTDATVLTWTGLTAEPGGTFTTSADGWHISVAAKAEGVAAATPRTMSVQRNGGRSGNDGLVAASLVIA